MNRHPLKEKATMKASPKTPKLTITLTGFLRQDPVERFTRPRTGTQRVPDPSASGGFVEQQVAVPPRPYWKLSLGVSWGGKTESHDCVIWNPEDRKDIQSADRAREGDRVVLTGYHEVYTFTRGGETVTGKHFVVESFERLG
jgi:hypothetical protein